MISFPDKLCDNRSFTSESTSPKIQSHVEQKPRAPLKNGVWKLNSDLWDSNKTIKARSVETIYIPATHVSLSLHLTHWLTVLLYN